MKQKIMYNIIIPAAVGIVTLGIGGVGIYLIFCFIDWEIIRFNPDYTINRLIRIWLLAGAFSGILFKHLKR